MAKHTSPAYPWRDKRSLAAVLAAVRPVFRRKRIIAGVGGYPQSAVAAAEKRLGRPLPPEVREFYAAVRPAALFSDDGPEEFGFYRLDQPELRWQPLDEATPAEDWARAEGLAIGQTPYGDGLWWVAGHRSHPDGCILLLDHEMALGDVQFLVIARSLREFLGKVLYFKGLDPYGAEDFDDFDEGDDNLEPKEEDSGGPDAGAADEPDAELFFREYAELNPTTRKWRTDGPA